MIKRYKLLSAMLALAMLFTMLAPLAFAEQTEEGTIRVAFPIQDALTEIDGEGYYTGYTYEYLERIAQTTRWNYEYVTVPGTPEEQFATLMDKADYSYLNQSSAQYYLNDPQFSELRISNFANRESSFCIAMPKSIDPILLNILNLSISSISSKKQNAIIFQNSTNEHTLTVRQYLRKNPSVIIVSLISIAVLIVTVLLLHTSRKEAETRMAKTQLDKHLSLCALSGDIFVEYNFKYNHLTISLPQKNNKKHAVLMEIDLTNPGEYQQNQAMIDAFIEIINSDTLESLEIQLPFFDGIQHWVELTVSKMYDEKNEPLYSLARLRLIDDKFTAQETLKHQAERDGLTQLYNIGHCAVLIDEQIAAFADGQIASLVLLDVDHFKSINDTYGHLAGNEALQAIAVLLQKSCPDTATIGRMGGDEFIIYLPSVSGVAEVETLCQTLCQGARQIRVSEQSSLTMSVGAVVLNHPSDQQFLVEAADIALYDVKRSRRNGYKVMSDIQDGHAAF